MIIKDTVLARIRKKRRTCVMENEGGVCYQCLPTSAFYFERFYWSYRVGEGETPSKKILRQIKKMGCPNDLSSNKEEFLHF